MKKLAKSILLLVILMNLGLLFSAYTAQPLNTAQAFGETPECTVSPLSPACILSKVGKDTKLPDFLKYNIHPDAPQDTQYENQGVATVVTPIYYAIDMFRFAISGIIMVYVIVLSIRLISGATAEEAEKAKDQLIYMVIGLLVVQFAGTLIKTMIFGGAGEAFTVNEDGDRVSQKFAMNSAEQIRGIIGLVEIFLGTVAVLVIIIRGFSLVVTGGTEESMTKAKNHILYAIGGLIIIGFSEIITRYAIFPNAGATLPNLVTIKGLVVQITNFISGFVAIGAFLMMLYGGYKYVVSGVSGDEGEKIKKIFISAIIGLVLSMGAYAAVNTLLGGASAEGNGGLPDTSAVQNSGQGQGATE
jgi:hypothetical protein